MSNDLAVKKTELVEAIEDKSLSELIKPLVNEIHLFDTYIAGTTHIDDQSVYDDLEIGAKLSLVREDNKFDDKAILVLDPEKRKLGYIPERDNLVFSRLMDAGKLLEAKIASHEVKGSFHKIGIGIYLVDY
jgi:hypothetical protein